MAVIVAATSVSPLASAQAENRKVYEKLPHHYVTYEIDSGIGCIGGKDQSAGILAFRVTGVNATIDMCVAKDDWKLRVSSATGCQKVI